MHCDTMRKTSKDLQKENVNNFTFLLSLGEVHCAADLLRATAFDRTTLIQRTVLLVGCLLRQPHFETYWKVQLKCRAMVCSSRPLSNAERLFGLENWASDERIR